MSLTEVQPLSVNTLFGVEAPASRVNIKKMILTITGLFIVLFVELGVFIGAKSSPLGFFISFGVSFAGFMYLLLTYVSRRVTLVITPEGISETEKRNSRARVVKWEDIGQFLFEHDYMGYGNVIVRLKQNNEKLRWGAQSRSRKKMVAFEQFGQSLARTIEEVNRSVELRQATSGAQVSQLLESPVAKAPAIATSKSFYDSKFAKVLAVILVAINIVAIIALLTSGDHMARSLWYTTIVSVMFCARVFTKKKR